MSVASLGDQTAVHTPTRTRGHTQPTVQTRGMMSRQRQWLGIWVMRFEVLSTDLKSLSASLILFNATGTKSH